VPKLLLRNLALLDPVEGLVRTGHQVLVDGRTIAAVEHGTIAAPDAEVLDLGGRTLMPGLIDCHVHLNRTILPTAPVMLPSLLTAHAGATLRGMLMRGFTTVRDAGGADAGHRQAVEQGLFTGPRVFVSGRAISQTGGHGDPRSPADLVAPCDCVHLEAGLGRIADGVPEVRKAVRDEIRLGADQIKVMAGGGIASQADFPDQLQYSQEELDAICDEAQRSRTYVMAHVFTTEGIRRCIHAGVRTIEHGYFLDDDTAMLMKRSGTYLSINLLTVHVIANGRSLGYTDASIAKAQDVLRRGTRAYEIALHKGVKVAFATDLSRAPERMSEEFLIRAETSSPADIIRSATVVGAEVVRMPGKLGRIVPGAYADFLAIDGNPLEDIRLLTGEGRHMPLIVKDGNVHKNTLA
jgi:imidazolonepropionase-like amidohydrolase